MRKKRKIAQECTRLLVGKDTKSKGTFAHWIPHKGVSQSSWNFERVNEDLKHLSYKRVVLKNDKEPAIVAQVREAQRITIGVEIVDKVSHTNDPQSNGAAEQAVWTVKSKTTSVVATLERMIGRKVPHTSSHRRVGRTVHGGLPKSICDRIRWADGHTAINGAETHDNQSLASGKL